MDIYITSESVISSTTMGAYFSIQILKIIFVHGSKNDQDFTIITLKEMVQYFFLCINYFKGIIFIVFNFKL